MPRLDPERLARGLGWSSLGLGVAQLVAPGRLNRVVGVPDGSSARTLTRAVGVREIATGIGILAERGGRARWLRARAAGDAMDLALLAAALRSESSRRGRVAGATAAVAGVAVADLLTAAALSTADHSTTTKERAMNVRTAVTVARSREEVYGFWRKLENLPRFMIHLESVEEIGEGRSRWVATAPGGRTVGWDAEITQERPGDLLAWRSLPGSAIENEGTVRFEDAPGDRGTEVHVDLSYDAPGGALGDVLAKLAGEQPEQQVKDDLRRLKQVLETGEIVVSEGSPAGLSARQQLHRRPAQPFERERQPAAR